MKKDKNKKNYKRNNRISKILEMPKEVTGKDPKITIVRI